MTKNYLKKTEGGSWVATKFAPVFNATSTTSDYYIDGTWYDSTGTAYTTPITYANIVALIDEQGNVVDYDSIDIPTLVEKSIKADVVTGGEFKSKNSCTAWCNFDGTTTPPTIRDSYNVSQVIRTATGIYDIYFEEPMDRDDYVVTHAQAGDNNYATVIGGDKNRLTSYHKDDGSLRNTSVARIAVFGGKN